MLFIRGHFICFSYGTIRPNFFSGPLDAAIREAFDRPIIEERRPLLIYLHDDESIASHVFAQNVSSYYREIYTHFIGIGV
jgi:hypothetical protein